MAADPDHVFTIPDNDFFGLGPAEYAGEAYQQGLVKAAGIGGLFLKGHPHGPIPEETHAETSAAAAVHFPGD